MLDFLWNDLLINPMINALIILSNALFDNYGLAIIAFTIVIRVLTYPLTIRQLRTTRAMSAMQPQLQEIQKKYKDPKRRQQEMMKLYREVGFNPLGCAVPLLLQFPILIALFQVIRRTLGTTPEALLSLSSRLYDWDFISQAVPLNRDFLTMDLAANGGFPLAILVGVATFYQQKFSTSRSGARDDRQASMNRTMLYMMPLMIGFFTITLPSGLGVYWLASSVVGVALAYLYNRPRNLTWRWFISLEGLPTPPAGPAPAAERDSGTPNKPNEPTEAPEPDEAPDRATTPAGAPADAAAARRRRRRRRRSSGTAARERSE